MNLTLFFWRDIDAAPLKIDHSFCTQTRLDKVLLVTMRIRSIIFLNEHDLESFFQ